MRTELFWIPGPTSGRIAIMPRPRGGDWLEDEVRAWRAAGVDVVVSLLEGSEIADFDLACEEELCQAHGIRFLSFPIADRSVPTSREEFLELLTDLGKCLADGKDVAIHCRQGIGRAALIAIGLLVTAGIDADTAIERASAARGCAVPETAEQKRWITALANETLKPVKK